VPAPANPLLVRHACACGRLHERSISLVSEILDPYEQISHTIYGYAQSPTPRYAPSQELSMEAAERGDNALNVFF
jgi:hypothetical protein